MAVAVVGEPVAVGIAPGHDRKHPRVRRGGGDGVGVKGDDPAASPRDNRRRWPRSRQYRN